MCDEISKERRPLAGDRRRLQAHDVENDLALALLYVRRVAICHLVGEDAETPDVYLAIILFLALDELGRHPADRAHATRAMLSFTCQLRRVSEVGQFYVALSISQDIITLDISVDHMPLVHRLETEQALPHHVLARVLAVIRL